MHFNDSNPIGCLQERMQKDGLGFPVYKEVTAIGQDHSKEFITQVSLSNGLLAEGSGATKKAAKHAAAKAMLNILDGKAKAVTNDVRESIDHGLAALRGDAGPSGLDLGTGSSVGKPVPGNSSLASSPFFLDLTQQNLGLNEEARIRKQNKEKRRKKNTGAYIPPNIKETTVQSSSAWIKEMLMEEVNLEIDRQRLAKEPQAEEICKLCNLVFINEKMCKKHKKGDFHSRVQQGDFPGKGGFHCFLCWVNYLQPENLLNHISRPNHQDRAKKEGVLKIWMEPAPLVPTWDTIKMFSELRSMAEEEERKWGPRSGSRSPPRRKKPRGRSPDADIKEGVRGDWRLGREKTSREVERIKQREREERRYAERQLRLKRERDERMRQEWNRKLLERDEMRERQRETERRRRIKEEAYWRKKEEQEWLTWREREDRRMRDELAWRVREDQEWREREERMWRMKESELYHGESSFFDTKLRSSRSSHREKSRTRKSSKRSRDETDSELEEGEYVEIKQEKSKKVSSSRKDGRSKRRLRPEREMSEEPERKIRMVRSPINTGRRGESDLREMLRKRFKTKSSTRSRSRSRSRSSSAASSSSSSSSSSSFSDASSPPPPKSTKKKMKMKEERGGGIKKKEGRLGMKKKSGKATGDKLLKVRSAILGILDQEINTLTKL